MNILALHKEFRTMSLNIGKKIKTSINQLTQFKRQNSFQNHLNWSPIHKTIYQLLWLRVPAQ